MLIETFILENRAEIDKYIREIHGQTPADDDEREDWIMNDESLYNWAQSEGVDI